jgi:hypothetical protein
MGQGPRFYSIILGLAEGSKEEHHPCDGYCHSLGFNSSPLGKSGVKGDLTCEEKGNQSSFPWAMATQPNCFFLKEQR